MLTTINLKVAIGLLHRLNGRLSASCVVMTFLAVLLIGGAASVHAQNKQRMASEQELKAGLLTLFPQYTTWPASIGVAKSANPSQSTTPPQSTKPIMICVLGSDPFGALLDQYALGRKGANPLTVKRINTPDDSEECQIVFIAKTETAREAAWLAALQGKPVLTVGESGKTIARGGAIEFKQINQRIRFEVNLEAVTSAHLSISSGMLAYASEVYRAPSTPEGAK